MKNLIAIGASVSASCQPYITYHHAKAREMGIDEETARAIRDFLESLVKAAIIELDCNNVDRGVAPIIRSC